MPNFKVFKKPPVAAAVDYPAITLGKTGMITINPAAHAAIGSPKAVLLKHDPAEGLAAVAPAAPGDENAYAARTRVLTAAAFIRALGLDMDRSRRYAVTVSDGMLVLDINGPYEPVGWDSAASGP